MIRNCVNYARVISTDAKGVGGICGAAWNGGLIENCYNMGNVTGGWPAGGIAGSSEVSIVNCYNYGYVSSAAGSSFGEAIGTRNVGTASVSNCYFLTGSSSDSGYYPNGASGVTEKTAADMTAADFVTALGSAYTADTRSINGGYPLLTWQLSNTETSDIVSSVVSDAGTTATAPETTATTVTTETKVENGSATVTVDSGALTAAAESADKNTQIVLSADTKDETVSSVTTSVSMEAISAVADSGASVKVETPVANIVLSNEALADLVTADGGTVTVSAQAKDGATTIAIAVDGETVESVSGGLKVAIPVETAEEASAAGLVAVLVNPDGTETVIKKSLVDDGSASLLLSGSATIKFVDNTQSFDDVEEDWYTDAVAFATSHDLFNGTGDGQFQPKGDMTRAMLVTVLYRLEDSPESVTGSSFGDVKADSWYDAAVAWAADSSIVNGNGSGGFDAEASISREQLATMLYRYMKQQGADVSVQGDVSAFPDGGETSAWASEAMQWAVGAGILSGQGDGSLAPQGNASRAEVATMLQRLVGLMVQ